MVINYDGEEYSFDIEEITLAQATIIKNKCGLTLMDLEDGLGNGDPAALRAIYWLMMIQNSKKVDIDRIDFKIIKFARAIDEANGTVASEADPKGESVSVSPT